MSVALGSRVTGNEPPHGVNHRGRDTTEGVRHADTEYRSTDPPPAVVVRVLLTFDRAATDYLGDCERRGFTPTSLVTYNRTYVEFADFIPVDTDVSKVTTDDLRRYLNTKSRLAKGTRAGFEAHLAGLFKWLLREGKIAKDPMVGITRTRRLPAEDLDVVTVSTEDVRRMLAVAEGWPERLCLGVLVFTGCRRRAASRLRLSDYDQLHRRLRFREKGGKTIWKPVPDELDNLIRAAISAGVYSEQDYLIPNLGPRPLGAPRERSHRVIYDIVKIVAARAGVVAHTHSLRAAFAVYYLETHQRDTLALQSLLGHRSGNTTQIYLRKLDRQHEMERVRDLSWGVNFGEDREASTGNRGPDSHAAVGPGTNPSGPPHRAAATGLEEASVAGNVQAPLGGLLPLADENEVVDPVQYVYFIAAGDINVDGTPVKVGFSGDPHGRMADLQTSYPTTLVMVATVPGPMSLERECQVALADDHLRGEWFSSSERLRTFILSLGNAQHYVSVGSGGIRFHEDRLVGAGGFEPPKAEDPLQQRPRTQPLTDALNERLEQAVSEQAEEPV